MGLLDDIGSALYGAAGTANQWMDDPLGQAKGLLQDRLQRLANGAAQNTQAAQMMSSSGPAMQEVGQQQLFNSMLNSGGLLAMPTVYHGSPHKFDNFDLSKIGTGEGAQVYGHGIYFAENPEVAKLYREQLTAPKYPSLGVGKDSSGKWIIADGSPNPRGTFDTQAQAMAHVDELLSAAEKSAPNGAVYKQELPDSVLPRMLQWDKPLSEQPEAVQKAIAPVLDRFKVDGKWWGDPINTGADLYRRVSARSDVGGSPDDTAAVLRSLGIPGLSYLDAGSRGAGNGTMNHVIWDQGLLNQMLPTPVK